MAIDSICILRLSAIGDVCNAVAAVQAIQTYNPDTKITWIIGKIEKVLLDGLPNVEFIVFDKSQGKAAYKKLKQDMQNRRFDVLLHMQVAFRANYAAWLIPAKRKIGFDRKRSKELHSLVVNERIKAQEGPHVLDGFFAFANKVGVPENAIQQVSWHIPVPDADKNFADEQVSPNEKTLVISPAASKEERNWLPERYAAIADYAFEKGFRIVLCGGPGPVDKQLGEQILQHAHCSITNLIGKTNLKQMLAILGNASILLSPDTGPGHMANSQGTPVLGLYAHSNPKRTGPYLFQNDVVEVYYDHLIKQHGKPIEQLAWDTRVKGHDPMYDISVDQVKSRFDDMVNRYEL